MCSGSGVARTASRWSPPSAIALPADFPFAVDDLPAAPLDLVYIDDTVDVMLRLLPRPPSSRGSVRGTSRTTARGGRQPADQLRHEPPRPDHSAGRHGPHPCPVFHLCQLPRAGELRVSPAAARGPAHVFVEMLRRFDSGQVSYFSAPPGATRGRSATAEKFLVINGTAWTFHVTYGQRFEALVDGEVPRVVNTVPGWAHT